MAVLKGMEQIVKYAQRSESTILDWVHNWGFPASKIANGSIWESDTDLVDDWRKAQITGDKDEVKRPSIKKTMRRGRKK